MTPNKLMLRALNGERSERPPFWFMRQAGRYLPEYREVRRQTENFLQFCYSPDLAVEVTLQPLRRYHMDAAILFSDILVIPDALGQSIDFREGQGPVLEPVRTASQLDALTMAGLERHLEPVFETVRRLSEEIPPQTTLIGFAGAPWTVAVYMVEGSGGSDFSTPKRWAEEAPEEFGRLIDLLIEASVLYLIRQVENGAEVLQLFDSWAGILPEPQFRRWVVGPTVEIVDRLRRVHPDVPIIGFPRNAGPLYEIYVRETGVDGVGLDSTVPLDWAANTLQAHAAVQGNLDNQLLVSGGQAMENEVVRILETLSNGPFIFNLGHGVLPETPPEHVGRVAELVHGWSTTKASAPI